MSDPTLSADAVSVIVCAFADERLDATVAAVRSALEQSPPPREVIVVVDHNERLREALAGALPDQVVVLSNAGPAGLSSARNTGIAAASGGVIAFLDDDAIAAPGWLSALCHGFSGADVLGVGGRAAPVWETVQPGWFPDAFLWVVGCSYAGQPEAGEVRNPLGCNMAFRREVFAQAGGFDTDIGRLGSRPLGCEETELCIRARRVRPEGRFVLVRGAEISHRVPDARRTVGYFMRRCFYEGVSKALVRTLGDARSLGTERAYVGRTLSSAVARALLAAVVGPDRRDACGRLGAVVGGLAMATAGFLVGSYQFRLNRRPAPERGDLR